VLRVQGGDILSLSGTGMFWLKHWVGQATSASRSTAQAVFEREHLREGGTKGSGTDNFVPNKTEREKRGKSGQEGSGPCGDWDCYHMAGVVLISRYDKYKQRGST